VTPFLPLLFTRAGLAAVAIECDVATIDPGPDASAFLGTSGELELTFLHVAGRRTPVEDRA
jgi:hypothetical protein